MGRGAEAGPACWIAPAKASFPTRTQAVLELGELARLPEGSPRPGSEHRDVRITRACPAHLHRSTLLHKGQRLSGSLGMHALCLLDTRTEIWMEV